MCIIWIGFGDDGGCDCSGYGSMNRGDNIFRDVCGGSSHRCPAEPRKGGPPVASPRDCGVTRRAVRRNRSRQLYGLVPLPVGLPDSSFMGTGAVQRGGFTAVVGFTVRVLPCPSLMSGDGAKMKKGWGKNPAFSM